MYMLHVGGSIRDGTYELGTPRHCIVSGSPCLQRSVWIGPPGLLGLTSPTRFLKHPTRFFPSSSLSSPACLSACLPHFFLACTGVFICHCVVCDMGCFFTETTSFVSCTIDKMHQINPAHRVACPPPPFSPEASSTGSFLVATRLLPFSGAPCDKSSLLVARDLPRRIELYRQTLFRSTSTTPEVRKAFRYSQGFEKEKVEGAIGQPEAPGLSNDDRRLTRHLIFCGR
ncbi:hypothetical protein BKA59DRAFT_241310 [Fusarium tricinctum]|uniref:Uncharacterized protein n=1 Tax=Fusarium tricinctum TaxID=61284 RepID=A0A8K0RTW4_9HYPO|nr:hypothetical protein BKA59DRAFT_241310 [Fusarium tricinctum]